MNITENQLIAWSRPVSDSEDAMCQRAITQITEALRAKFGTKVSIFLQGSYRNNTNVRKNSDVDIVMRFDDAFYSDLVRLNAADAAIYNARHTDYGYNFTQLKNDTEQALRIVFGDDVKRKNKCIEVRGNTYRVTADVIPCFTLRRPANLERIEAEGIKFYSETNQEIISFPNQHYENGTSKTNNTYRLYKRMVRILKVINNRLIDDNKISDKLASSFFIECLVYNVPDHYFINGNYTQTLRNVISKIYEDMQANANYKEVSCLLWLFDSRSPRTHKDALDFMQHCWNFVGY
ncbi:nucleotidyltransferase domain-containing protein [Chitinophaga agri]|uniref:Nucleotidyltransferase n=1 Tax=Chitinophaga agri TaxID=2703787 RepID=A0A6B9ZNI2_9BACT|nr:nucleotidyltransferase [Chitinophaga agri]QHS63527.1 nucleotidyltransferase [Chitinophaga agri]